MNVQIVNTGSYWWDRTRDTIYQSCVYNTTGFCGATNQKRCWMRAGVVRFNRNDKRAPNDYRQIQGMIFASRGPHPFGEQTRLLLHPRLDDNARIDAYLVCIDSTRHGRIHFRSNWKTPDVMLIASSSQGRKRQETLILMGPNGRIQTSRGVLDLPWLMNELSQ